MSDVEKPFTLRAAREAADVVLERVAEQERALKVRAPIVDAPTLCACGRKLRITSINPALTDSIAFGAAGDD